MLARLCARLGIDAADVAAFGDMPNDVDCSAGSAEPYVVANAHPALLALGFPVVPTNAESGVGQTIRDCSAERDGRDRTAPGRAGCWRICLLPC